jgi:hypothetical protein
MEGAEYRCTIPLLSKRVGDVCGAVVEQSQMPHHLVAEHKMDPTIESMLAFFVLHRASTMRGRASRGKVEDETAPMFDRKDFR